MPSEAKLKPCPFCGDKEPEVEAKHNGADKWYYVMCMNPDCYAATDGCLEKTEDLAVKKWNTRASRATPDIDKALKEMALGDPCSNHCSSMGLYGDCRDTECSIRKNRAKAILTNLAPAESDTVKVLEKLRREAQGNITKISKATKEALDNCRDPETEAYQHGWTEGEVEGIGKAIKTAKGEG